MNILITGAAGFIGTNLILRLSAEGHSILAMDDREEYFSRLRTLNPAHTSFCVRPFQRDTNFDDVLERQEIVFHLANTSPPDHMHAPGTNIAEELSDCITATSRLLDACVRHRIQTVVFISSGGAVYGKDATCPISENAPLMPVNSNGIQKASIEHLLYLYQYLYDLHYKVVRLANPYGPYQRPNGVLGALTTFTDRMLREEEIVVYGDGSVVRDFIYIDDAISAIINVAMKESKHSVYNIGSGEGISIKDIIARIENVLEKKAHVTFTPSRKTDIPENYLDISRYEAEFGSVQSVSMDKGISLTAAFLGRD
ncbi:MAG: NAD-dependent epimerase/dehydratase family protein [Lachnospiraceae bacterium]|nr:NAD-dependent epimerase/dehydratase family protein [Lachnospiraceae bacterium]